MATCAELAQEYEFCRGQTPSKNPVTEDIIRFAMFTMMYRIAADFQGGKFHDEIVKQFISEIRQ